MSATRFVQSSIHIIDGCILPEAMVELQGQESAADAQAVWATIWTVVCLSIGLAIMGSICVV
jgi:hypothetical protein